MTYASALNRWSPQMLAVLRIVMALIFIEHGTQKLFDFPPSTSPQPPAFSLFWWGGVLEAVGGLLILVGLLTRPVAFILAGERLPRTGCSMPPKASTPSSTEVMRLSFIASCSSTSCLPDLVHGALMSHGARAECDTPER